MRKSFHKHVKDLAELARPGRLFAGWVHRSRGHSFDARIILGSVAGAELKHACGCDLPVRERSSELLRALISALFISWMPHGLEAVRVLPRVTG